MKTALLLAGLFMAAIPLSAASPSGERFATELFARWCADGGNVIFSPFSLSSALAMTAAGARGETAAQIAAALDLSTEPEQLAEAFGALNTSFDAARQRSPDLAFSVANALFPQQGFALRPAFLETVHTRFKGQAIPVDYRTQPETARTTINTWVETQTANRIRDLIAPGILTPMTRLTLVNAIYFKGAWAVPFDVKLTQSAPFTAPGKVTLQAPLMQRQGRMSYAELNGIQAVEIPYAGNRFAMLVLLPRVDGSLADVAALLTAKGLHDWPAQAQKTEVVLFLPRFTSTWEQECTRTLAQLGIVDLFDEAKADLSGMAGNRGDLAVSAVVHKAFIEVNEAGTEAAAATAVAVRMTAIMPEERPVIFRADRPFAYLIREQASGAILFAGVVVKP